MKMGSNYQITSFRQLPAMLKSTLTAWGIFPGQTFSVEHISESIDIIQIRPHWGNTYGFRLSEILQLHVTEVNQ